MFRIAKISLRQVARKLRGLWHQNDGNVAVTFAIALIPILSAVGAAVDYSRANGFKTSLQAALDAGLLAGAKNGDSNWVTLATDTFKANVDKLAGSASNPAFKRTSSETYSASVSGSLASTVMGLFNIPNIKVSVSATAIAAASDDSCILTLDHGQPASHVSLSLNGAPIVNVSGCSIRSNTSIDCQGHDGGATNSIAAGSAADCSRPHSNAPAVPDIYSSLATNITTACSGARPGVTWNVGTLPSGSAIKTVNRGSYTEYHICGDLTLSGSGTLLATSVTPDNVIVIENGTLTVTSGSSVSTSRTAIVMTGDNNHASFIKFPTGQGQAATLSLSAPRDSSNPWQGVALYQDPALTYKVDNNWGPGATLNADGLVYLGNSNVTTDGSTGSANSKCSKFVMNGFVTNGQVDLNLSQNIGGCTAVGLKQWRGIVVRLTN